MSTPLMTDTTKQTFWLLFSRWHLGFCKWEYTPTFRGFDTFFGFYSGHIDYYTHRSGRGRYSNFKITFTIWLMSQGSLSVNPIDRDLYAYHNCFCTAWITIINNIFWLWIYWPNFIVFFVFSERGLDFRLNTKVARHRGRYSTVSIMSHGLNLHLLLHLLPNWSHVCMYTRYMYNMSAFRKLWILKTINVSLNLKLFFRHYLQREQQELYIITTLGNHYSCTCHSSHLIHHFR